MSGEAETVTIWKCSLRGLGDRHLKEGYTPSDFPGAPGQNPDGCAYFARDRWIAELFSRYEAYEDFVIETKIPESVYVAEFQQYEEEFHSSHGIGIELAIPSEHLEMLNSVGIRFRAERVSQSHE